MFFKIIRLSLLTITYIILIIIFIYYEGFADSILKRITGVIIALTFASINAFIWLKFLFKSEKPVKKINLSHKYLDISAIELEKMGIDSEKYKSLIFEKFKIVHDAFNNLEFDVLKTNLTIDLYNYYLEQLEVFKSLNRKYVISDIELIDIKLYEVDNFRIKAYLNVKMYDYIIDLDTLKCIYGSEKKKKDLEYEIYFEKKNDISGLFEQYVISKKYCINEMDNKKNKYLKRS